jgi:hypothetical protein
MGLVSNIRSYLYVHTRFRCTQTSTRAALAKEYERRTHLDLWRNKITIRCIYDALSERNVASEEPSGRVPAGAESVRSSRRAMISDASLQKSSPE